MRKARVLLVEDQAIIALSTAQMLTQEGHEVSTEHSGERALERIAKSVSDGTPFDIVLADIDLGIGMDGVQTARRILEIVEVPIVFLTGHGEREYVERVRRVTRYGYVLKSGGDLTVRLAIEMALDLFDANQGKREQHRELRAIYDHVPLVILVVRRDLKVCKASHRARVELEVGDEDRDNGVLGCAVRCSVAAAKRSDCGRLPECRSCRLRLLVADTIETGAVHRDVPVEIEVGSKRAGTRRRISVSAAPLDCERDRCALVSIVGTRGDGT